MPLGVVVVTTGHDDDAEEEPEEGPGVALPGDQWILQSRVAVAHVVHEDVDRPVEDLQLPVSFQNRDVTQIDVDGSHCPWGGVQNHVRH